MNAPGCDKPRERPARRNQNGRKRVKKIEVKLTEQEYTVVRQKFGRHAAAMARAHWLGFRVANPTTPNKQHILNVASALFAHRLEGIKLRRLVADGYGESAARLLKNEQTKFNTLTHLWLSIYSAARNKTRSQEE